MSSLAQVVQELLLSILGFPGDIIVCDTSVEYDIGTNDADIFRVGMFHVRDGCTAVTEAERDQINRLAPLGTYYVCFNRYCQRYFIQWKHIDQRSELHRLAVAGALQDVLNEYVDDVADLEVDYCSDTTLPLSAFVQRMQKVSCLTVGLAVGLI